MDPSRLPRIMALSSDVVGKIAAGEVIQRPCNAVKELVENSLDAGSTMIQVHIRGGGMKLVQVLDNGYGIDPADLPILCQRFTTSKIRDFEDLSRLQTLGFRGEALSSLSYVTSRLTVTSRRPVMGNSCAYRANFSQGELVASPTDHEASVRACAGEIGTCVQAEDLFYNLPARRDALHSVREEYARVADIVAKYSLHYAGRCGFFLRALDRKAGCGAASMSMGGDLRTAKDWDRVHVVRAVFGENAASDLQPVSHEQTFTAASVNLAVGKLGLKFNGLFSNPDKITSDGTPSVQLVLFVNNRLIECPAMKKAVEAAYAGLLPHRAAQLCVGNPRSSSCSALLFAYLALELPTTSLDVNVHPTKVQIHFLHEEEIVAAIRDAVEEALRRSSDTRSLLMHSMSGRKTNSPSRAAVASSRPLFPTSAPPCQGAPSSSRGVHFTPPVYRPERMVRTDARDRRLEAFLSASVASGNGERKRRASDSPEILASDEEKEGEERDKGKKDIDQQSDVDVVFLEASDTVNLTAPSLVGSEPPSSSNLSTSKRLCSGEKYRRRRRGVALESVRVMREAEEARASAEARSLLRECIFVGLCAPSPSSGECLLVQRGSDLLLLRLEPLARSLFYQLLIANFANHGEMLLSSPAPVRTLLVLGMRRILPEASVEEMEMVVDRGHTILSKRSAMLWDYFSLRIEANDQGVLLLHTLPLLLDNYIPDLSELPKYLARLVREVNWNEESACFASICRITADFYVKRISGGSVCVRLGSQTLVSASVDDEAGTEDEALKRTGEDSSSWLWVVEHALFPAIRNILLPTHSLCFPTGEESSCAVIKLTSLPDLYKVFERC